MPEPETYNLYSALSITVTATVVPIPSNHSPPFTVIHNITQLYVQIIHILVHYVFLGLALCLAPSISKTTHFFTQSSSSFLTTCPHHHGLFLWTTFTMSSIPNRCLSSMQDSLSFNFTRHIQQIILISVQCDASFTVTS